MIEQCRYYVEVSGSGEPVLLLHGFTGSSSTWSETVAFLKEDYQCIAVDLIGHGKSSCPSDKERYDIELAARDIKELMSELGHTCFHVLGYSMGGRLALTIAVLFPEAVQSLILESASPGLKVKEERVQRQEADALLATKIEQEGIKSFVEYWEKIPLFHTQNKLPLESQEAIRKQRLQNSIVGLSRSLRGMGTGSQPSWWQKLSELTMPVLLIRGTEDIKFTNIAREMSGLLQSVVRKEVNGAGHAIHVEDCAKFGTIIKEFLLHT